MTIVYSVHGHDNDSYAFRGPGLERCSNCGLLQDKWSKPLPNLRLTKRSLDVSATYDGLLVGSERFVAACEQIGLAHLLARSLPGDPQFFSLASDQVVSFDFKRRKTRFDDKCPRCGRYLAVAGATPVFLSPGAVVQDMSFAQTDLEFGSGDEQHPLLLCGEAAGEELLARRFRGIELLRWEY